MGAGPPGIGVPGLAPPLPAPGERAELPRPRTGAVDRRKGFRCRPVAPLHRAVPNVPDGPGVRPVPHRTPAAARIRETGVRLLGHLGALRMARRQGAGTVYFTDRRAAGAGAAGGAWESLPGYWDEFVSRIGPGVSE
ncbi:hypothetical protein [Streptomyces sp. CT34]|uniref:hypothetical protein n=1 Tax=Streptomyces sp. CT34 TaxID=1553907 RepID=UPI0005B82D54|nr:hypothetical protein [Streptomyces sp. CT34]